jgi:hypothetical protein
VNLLPANPEGFGFFDREDVAIRLEQDESTRGRVAEQEVCDYLHH